MALPSGDLEMANTKSVGATTIGLARLASESNAVQQGKPDFSNSDEESTRPPSVSSIEVETEERSTLVRMETTLENPIAASTAISTAAASEGAPPKFLGVSMKWVSLIALTLQTSGQVLLIKWARAEGLNVPYMNTTVVAFTEVIKTLASLVLVVFEAGSVVAAAQSVREHFTTNPTEVLKAAIPALIYTVQNNLMFYSLEKLSAPVQQVLYQMKILTTAGLGVLMLGKSLSTTKWSALLMLASGVALVQWPRHSAEQADQEFGTEQLKGFFAVLLACVTSGFAAVYIQKMLQQTTSSIWMRNVQFGLFGSVTAFLVAFGQDGAKIQASGITQGYSLRVYSVIFMNAFGGLLCAAMLKYAGATLGCFSTAISIIITCILSATFLDDFVPDEIFVLGTFMAVAASLLFGLGLPDAVLKVVEKMSKPSVVKSESNI